MSQNWKERVLPPIICSPDVHPCVASDGVLPLRYLDAESSAFSRLDVVKADVVEMTSVRGERAGWTMNDEQKLLQ
jgi:hypothetical protein